MSVPQFPTGSGSWNPKVPCTSPWIVRVTDITNNQTGSTSLSNSLFNPGITSPVGTAKRWLTPGPTPPGWVSPGPPCTITNSHGTVAMFVEIDGIKRGGITNEDCTGNYDTVNGGTSNGGSYCDSTFNTYDPTIVPNYSTSCTSATDPTCYGRIHAEIDHDWKAARYCGPSTTCDDGALGSQTTTSSLLDIQGFVYWDPGHLTESWHSFSGWEIHPLTGWRLHQSSASPDFGISASPTSVSALANAVATSSITTVPLNGFTGTVALTPTFSPAGLACSMNPASIALGSSQTSILSCNGPAGTYTVTVTGTSGSLSHSTAVLYTIADFNVSASPTTVSLNSGGTGTSTVTVAPVNGFTGIVNLSPSVSPSTGLSCGLSPSGITGSGTSTLSCTASSNDLYTVTVTGTDAFLSHSTAVSYTVTSTTDFSTTANPTSLAVNPGVSGISMVTIAPLNGFTGTVALTSIVSPDGLTCGLSPNSVVLGPSQTSALSCSGLGGTYNVTVTGISGSLSHSATVNFSVRDFTMTANPATVNITPGITSTSTITVTSLGGFSGTVSLASVASNGLTALLNPANVTLTSGGKATSTLTVSSSTVGNYSAAITGTSGSLSRTVSVNVIVSDFSITASPNALSLPRSSTTSSLITLTSLNGFTGTVTLSESVTPTSPRTSLSATSITLSPSSSGTSTLTIRTLKKTPIGSYTVTITSRSGSLSHTITLQVTVTT